MACRYNCASSFDSAVIPLHPGILALFITWLPLVYWIGQQPTSGRKPERPFWGSLSVGVGSQHLADAQHRRPPSALLIPQLK